MNDPVTHAQPPAIIQAEFSRWHEVAVQRLHSGQTVEAPPAPVMAWCQRHSPAHADLIKTYLDNSARPAAKACG